MLFSILTALKGLCTADVPPVEANTEACWWQLRKLLLLLAQGIIEDRKLARQFIGH